MNLSFELSLALKKFLVFSMFFGISLFSIMYKDLTKPIQQTVVNPVPDMKIVEPRDVGHLQDINESEAINEKTITVNAEESTPTMQLETRSYVVQKGDSLWSISEKFYGTGFEFYKIMKQNEIINPNTLRVGQVLNIPNV